MDISQILTLGIDAFTAEIPVFVLILHLTQRIVKLETHIEILVRNIDNGKY